MKISFVTLGCKVNLCETQGLMQLALEHGDEIVYSDADVVIVNSCAVTATSEHKNLRALHKAKKENPKAIIAVMGCMAQTNAEKLRKDGTADLIFGVQDRAAILDLCAEAIQNRDKIMTIPDSFRIISGFEELPAGIPKGRTRALLKVEDGCNNFCSYCAIPFARGRVRSLAPEKALCEAKRLSNEGVHEIVVTGIEISSYGQDLLPRSNLIELMDDLCRTCPDIRFRLGSLEPRTITHEFCQRLSVFTNLAPHFHLSLQSGCNSVLQRMNRKYTCEVFLEAVELLRESFPECSITADIIVGFPGETDAEFQETCTFIEKVKFSDIHVFPYSIRPGTRAANMPNQIREDEKKRRANILREIAIRHSEAYRKAFIGRVLKIIPEHCDQTGVWSSHSSYHFPVYVQSDEIRKNHPVEVEIISIKEDGLLAKLKF